MSMQAGVIFAAIAFLHNQPPGEQPALGGRDYLKYSDGVKTSLPYKECIHLLDRIKTPCLCFLALSRVREITVTQWTTKISP